MSFRSFSCFFLLASIFSFSKSENDDSYAKHCSSLLRPSHITHRSYDDDSLPSLSTPYFTDGGNLLRMEPGRRYYYRQKNLNLRLLPNYYQTTASGLYKVQGFLYIRFPYSSDHDDHTNYSYGGYNRRRNRSNGSLKFPLSGFWSKISRKLCMIGSARWRGVDRDAVLKLKFADEENPTINSSLVSGSLESTNDPPYFSPILIFYFPQIPEYKYSLVTKQVFPRQKDESLSMGALEFCSFMRREMRALELEYAAECRGSHRCSPLDGDGYLPRFLSVTSIQCVEGSKKARFMAKFVNSSYNDYNSFDTRSTVIGEASWDDESNRMMGVACRILNPSLPLGEVVVNCTMRLIISHPSVLTIRNDAKVVGQIWSSDSHFQQIQISSSDERASTEQRYEYKYTEVDKASKSCTKKEAKKGDVYPDPQSYDMRFDINIKNKKGQEVAWASATPTWVGNASYQHGDGWGGFLAMAPAGAVSYVESTAVTQPLQIQNTPTNMTYKIRINPQYFGNSSNQSTILSPSLEWAVGGVEITAEGVYDAANGQLCMVGCRKLVNKSIIFKDCDVLLELQLPPSNRERGCLTKGVIKSTRTGKDPLHFDDLILQTFAYYRGEAERSIWRMDLEIAMVLVSNTLACIFLALQIFHLKKNPEVPSSVSLVMLVVLSVGHMIPLVLNFEAVFLGSRDKSTLELGSGGRLEANEIAVRVITMVALLLQLRLFQIVWTAKQSSWHGEKKAGFGSLLMYILGALLTLIINWMRNSYTIGWRYSVWGDIRSYAGLILDGFLVPQILLNVVRGSAEKALSHPFYIGTSAVRLVPHAYNQYRAHNYPKFELNATYYYANPAADMYSTAWDIIIPCGVIALAVVVFVQQRHGGRCILPKRVSRGLEMYEKVPTAENQ
ncbi:(E3-independent) E2 ubiquitin-conjugating enzyme [Salvia divinorum]|uniref:RING-type E3 ubiquitin transferase n=1 Tax=Salvia divinorum TaxID=28513 RepID=A0ABD1I8R1_SALDI